MNNIIKDFGKVVCRLRTNSGISQEDFAKKANITRSYMSCIENGKRAISLSIMVKIACTLVVPLSQIFLEIEKLNRVSTQ